MGKLEDKLSELEGKIWEFRRYDLPNHIHCKQCGASIYGQRAGENEEDLERINPIFKYQLCSKCVTAIALKELKKEDK